MPNIFPDPRTECLDEGIIGVSGIVTVDMLYEAYSRGIFPWPHTEEEVLWFCPDDRGVLFFNELRIPKSLQKAKAKNEFTFTFNTRFEEVIRECAKMPRPDQDGTWITQKMIDAYIEFNKLGYIHCCECWEGNELVGGIYGVKIKNTFSGESMFYKKPNASKLALLTMIEDLKTDGVEWMDTQMVTPVTESLGAKTLTRNEYLDLLENHLGSFK